MSVGAADLADSADGRKMPLGNAVGEYSGQSSEGGNISGEQSQLDSEGEVFEFIVSSSLLWHEK